MDASVEAGDVGASVEVAEPSEQAGGGGGQAREPHAMVAARTYLPKAALEYTVHKLPGMLTRTLAEWGKTTIGAALQARGVAEADLPEQVKAIASQTLGDKADTTAAFRAIAASGPAHRCCCMLAAIPTWQPSELDLTVFPSDEVSAERDRLFVRLRRFATALHAELSGLGHWFDGSCPATGCCLFGERGGCTWNELDGLTQLLHYNHLPAGCCGIVLHPVSQHTLYRVRRQPSTLTCVLAN
eukprot:COSAG02_NODE_3429_length_6760_cov_3.222339_6_plen_242_part_00